MQSLFKALVTPEGERYNNSTDTLVLNTKIEIQDFKYTNRVGLVEEVPLYNIHELQKGDRVLVHHNTFRKYWAFSNRLKTSSSDLDDGKFGVDPDMLFAYDRGDGWQMIDDNILIEPIEDVKGDIMFNLDVHIPKQGIVRYARSNELVGTHVYFKAHREYEFRFDNLRLWKMKEEDLFGKII